MLTEDGVKEPCLSVATNKSNHDNPRSDYVDGDMRSDDCGCVDDAHGCKDVRLPTGKVNSNTQMLTMLIEAITATLLKYYIKRMQKPKMVVMMMLVMRTKIGLMLTVVSPGRSLRKAEGASNSNWKSAQGS